jgi:crotonobetainyl-CoA:carnitine CoA-transferase CaiB-like acyl-CoA transferase
MQPIASALSGIRVVDFTHVFQGPVGTQLLADYGADVIKVERPGSGDWSRRWGPFVHGVSLPFAGLNRNKRSVAIDVKTDAGKKIVHDLVRGADVVVHNFRGGVMEKLGFGYEQLAAINPRLVYAWSSGWGDKGPSADRARGGHDLMARAEAGWFTQPDPAKPPFPAGISADYAAGLMLVQGILMALLARERTGRGQRVTTDLLSVAFHAHSWEGPAALNGERITDVSGIIANEALIDKSFTTRNGYIEISPVFTENALRDLSLAIGLTDLSSTPQYATMELQTQHQREINALLAERFREKTTEEWMVELEPKGIFCAKVNTLVEAADDEQLQANGMVVDMEHSTAGKVRLLGTPVRLHGTPPVQRVFAAELGEHTHEVLEDLGYSTEAIAELERKGVVSQRTAECGAMSSA